LLEPNLSEHFTGTNFVFYEVPVQSCYTIKAVGITGQCCCFYKEGE